MSEKIKSLAFMLMLNAAVYSQTNEWTWMHGSSTGYNLEFVTNHGTQGISSPNTHPNISDGMHWTDKKGQVWLFGGRAIDTASEWTNFADLWKYNPKVNEWTWVKGTGAENTMGEYGMKGVSDSKNNPGSRRFSATWTGSTGDLWMFGGHGYGDKGSWGLLSDLWKYSPTTNEWTWVNGPKTAVQYGVWGNKGISDSANYPSPRSSSATWTDIYGNMWLFGGKGFDANISTGYLSDLWKYNPTANEWTWVKGVSTKNKKGVFGIIGISDTSNTPSARSSSITWTDSIGNFFMLGGERYDTAYFVGYLNDLWKFSPTTNSWTWINGSKLSNQKCNLGTQGVSSASNSPGGICNAYSCKDKSNTVYFLGGYGYDYLGAVGLLGYLWKYDANKNEWTWLKGLNKIGTVSSWGVYGTKGIYDSLNKPGSRQHAVVLEDSIGVLQIIGGFGYDEFGSSAGGMNDVWKYRLLTNEFTYISGARNIIQLASYGTIGVSAITNTPGYRGGAAKWTDANGNLWLFGGNTDNLRTTNDLWKFNKKIGEWTWVHGTKYGIYPNYGTQGVSSSLNIPGGREGAVNWEDNNGNFYLFGGNGFGGPSSYGLLNDVWKYNTGTNEWTWIKGSATCNQSGNYGKKGVPSLSNNPGGRKGAVSWIDKNGNYWLLGGTGYDAKNNNGELNDLWKYDISINTWTWISGSDSVNQLGIYGSQNTPSIKNIPKARTGASSWIDNNGNFWLMGGARFYNGFSGYSEYLNDLWKYNPTTNEWTWVNGSNGLNQAGIYGSQGIESINNKPGARCNAISHIDANGNLWLLGGNGFDGTIITDYLNDLWKYTPGTNLWTWMKGSSATKQRGSYGVIGIPNKNNSPGARENAVSWSDSSGNLWVYGGRGWSALKRSYPNDMWTYTPCATKTLSSTISVSSASICKGQKATFTAKHINGGTIPAYIWLKNRKIIAGEIAASYSTTTLLNNDSISFVITSSDACANPTSTISSQIAMQVNSPAQPTIIDSSNYLKVLNNYNSYQWFVGGVKISGATYYKYIPLKNGLYSIEVSDAGGCEGVSINSFNFITVGLDEIQSDESLYIYPNPATNEIIVSSKLLLPSSKLVVYDILGNEMQVQNLKCKMQIDGTFNFELSTLHLTSGVYFIKVDSLIKKFIRE